MEISKKQDLKSFLAGLLLCKVSTSIIVALIAAHFNKAINFIQFFIVLTFLGTGIGILIQLFLFWFYFFSVRYLAKSMKLGLLFYISLLLLAVSSFAIVLLIDWNLSKESYPSFETYIYQGNYYLVYTLMVILVLTIFGIISRSILNRSVKGE